MPGTSGSITRKPGREQLNHPHPELVEGRTTQSLPVKVRCIGRIPLQPLGPGLRRGDGGDGAAQGCPSTHGLIPTTMPCVAVSISARVWTKPASRIQPWQSAPE